MIKLFDGLDARSQNSWPNLKFDIMAPLDALSPFLTAGFYYKTFMWPAAFWEKNLRTVYSPLGRLRDIVKNPYPDTYDSGYLHCDVLVIGAGPSGLMAALTPAAPGQR